MKNQIPLPQKIRFTKDGYKKLEENLNTFLVRRKEAVIKLKTAREGGDLSENGAYKAARMELSFVDREIRQIKHLLRYGVIHENSDKKTIDFGHLVTLRHGEQEYQYTLVNQYEANPKEQKISVNSPIGKALIGRKIGDIVEVLVPSGNTRFTVVGVK